MLNPGVTERVTASFRCNQGSLEFNSDGAGGAGNESRLTDRARLGESTKTRLPTFKERPRALVKFLGVIHVVQGLETMAHRSQRHIAVEVQRHFGKPHGLWAVGEQYLTPLVHGRVEFVIRNNAIDPAKRCSVCG